MGSADQSSLAKWPKTLPNLPAALRELRRLVKPDGRLIAMIPCEGGMAYSFARRISAQRVFEKGYGMSYERFVASEHINLPDEIMAECEKSFALVGRTYFPLRVPVVTMNLVIGLEYQPRPS